MSDLVTAVTAWAERREDVRAVILVGSRARVDTPADAWSDTDLVLLVDDPPSYAADPRWLEAFGRPLLTFLEPTAVGGAIERRVLYEDGSDVDFALIPAGDALGVVRDERAVEVRAVFARGYRVLVDKMGVSATLPAVTGRPARVALPGQEE
ncbi:MAG: aminoglycoside 6-adenylyltransferase, partial [Chloroflexi bacterium]|nr:aminoglycoside 6-adenylyltransferase [Chloroflexota bacterium]